MAVRFDIEVHMKVAFKALLLLYILLMGVTQGSITPLGLAALLVIVGLHTCRERLYDSVYLLGVEFTVTTVAVGYGIPLGVWYASLAFDMAYHKLYVGVVAIAAAIYVLAIYRQEPMLGLLVVVAVVLAIAVRQTKTQHEVHQLSLDKERRLRYSLEEAKQKLLRSQEEVEHITEIQERNRIARQIHDNVGHNLAGILIQMQLAEKCLEQDIVKAQSALARSTEKLKETLEVLRDTVHNLRPVEKLGLDYLKAIINDYDYCPITFSPSGDFSSMPPRFVEVIAATIKEALTNTAKYSQATRVMIDLDGNERFVRLCIRDNGVGCNRVHEGLGLSGMRERVANLGGTLTVSGDDGFLIVCVLYR